MTQKQVFTRSYVLDGFTVGEGRHVEGRIVPYDTPTEVDDGDGPYTEVFTPVSLAAQFQAFQARHDYGRVGLNLDHLDRLDHRIGCAEEIRDEPDGVYATFGLYEGQDLTKVRSMLSTSHTGFSIEFSTRGRRIRDDGTVEHLGVQLRGVAATPIPAYAGAGITALRADDLTDPPTPILDAILERWGLEHLRSIPDTA